MKHEFEDKYYQYAEDILSGKIVACELIKLACQRYLSFFSKYEFRPEECEKFIRFCSHLHHFTGKFNGKPFLLLPWQQWIIYNIFGFYKKNTNDRVTTSVYIEVARKNGKSMFISAIANYMLFSEQGAEVDVVANSAKQAALLFTMAKLSSKTLPKAKKYLKFYRDSIKLDKTNSKLQVLSCNPETADGLNPLMYVYDELHEANDEGRKMWQVMSTGQGMRDNPIRIAITTAGFDKFGYCYTLRSTCVDILNNLKKNDSQFTAIYTLDSADIQDWTNEKNWIKANPSMGNIVRIDKLREYVSDAKNNNSEMVNVLTKNFNIWCDSASLWLNNEQVVKCTQEVDIQDFKGGYGYIGVDLSATSDLTAVSLLIPDFNEKYVFKTWYFLPESCLYNNENSDKYQAWQREKKLIITHGNVVDYDYITKTIIDINKVITITKVSYDSWNSTKWAVDAESAGLPLSPYSQSIASMNRPTKEFERLVNSGAAIIDNNQLTRWCVNNADVKEDWNDNRKIVKNSKMKKIDGAVAMIMALGGYLSEQKFSNEIFVVN